MRSYLNKEIPHPLREPKAQRSYELGLSGVAPKQSVVRASWAKLFFLPASAAIKINKVFRNVGNKAFSRRENCLSSDGEYYSVLVCSYQIFLVKLLSKFSWPYTIVFSMVTSGRYGFIALYRSKTFPAEVTLKWWKGIFRTFVDTKKERTKLLDIFSIYVVATYKFIHSLILNAFLFIRLRDLIIRERDQHCLKSPVFLLLIENSDYLTSIKIGNIRFDVIVAMKVVEINQACHRFSC